MHAKNEPGRKAIHLMGGLAIVIGYWLITQMWDEKIALMALILSLVVIFATEFARLELKAPMAFVRQFIRPVETTSVVSSVPLLAGAIIVYAAFDYEIAVAAVLMITVGEYAASMARMQFKCHPKKGKYHKCFNSDLIEFAVNIAIGALVIPNLLIGLSMAAVATIVEAGSIKINDNLMVPVLSGFVGQIISWTI